MRIGIAGNGLLGRLLAYHLRKDSDEHDIEIIDIDGTGNNNAAMVAAGMIAPFTELDKSDPIITKMGLESLDLWPQVINDIDKSIYFQKKGALVTAHHQDFDDLDHYLQKVKMHTDSFITLDQQQTLEPELSHLSRLYYFKDEGQIDSQRLMKGVAQWLPENNVRTYEYKFDPYEYNFVFDCRGIGAKSYFPELMAVRGEVVWVEAKDVNLTRPVRLLHPRHSIYIVPRPNNRYIVGASEIETEDYSPISVRSMMELLSSLYSVHKGFLEARVISTATQCRPTLPKHLPKINYNKHLIAVNGLYRHGFSMVLPLVRDIIRYLNNGLDAVRYPQFWEQNDAYYRT
jgi:glycine oxidase